MDLYSDKSGDEKSNERQNFNNNHGDPQSIIDEIYDGVSNLKGKKFFDKIILKLAEIINSDFLFIGELEKQNDILLKTISICESTKLVANFSYALVGTSWDIIERKKILVYKSEIQAAFPADDFLRILNIQGYIGVPFLDSKGNPIGILTGLYRKPLTQERAEYFGEIFNSLSARLTLDFEKQNLEFKKIQANKNLRQSERRYHSLFTRMIDGYALHELICDSTGKPTDYRFLDLNPSFENLTGLTRSILGKTVKEVMPDIEDSWIQTYGKVALTGKSIKFQNFSSALNKWFEVVAFRPEPNQFATIFVDITEKKESEEQLKHLKNLLTNIIDSMPSVLVGVDNEGHVIQWNAEAEKETGVSANEAQGKNIFDIFPVLEAEMERVRLSIEQRRPHKYERISSSKNGQTHFSDLTIYPLIANGVTGAVIRIDDITEKVRIEEMMIQSEKMMSVGGLAAGMAHEINNPLAGILQNTQVIQNRLNPDMEKNRQAAEKCNVTIEAVNAYLETRGIQTMLNAISESGKRAAQIVDNMLSFSRKSESRFTPFDIRELMDQTIFLASSDYDLKKKYDFRNIEIVKEYEPDIPAILCEGTKIQQVFLNLLKNGAHAMTEKKHLHANQGTNLLENPKFTIRIRYEKEIDSIHIELEDNGTGMDENTSKRAFEPFFTTKSPGVGTGLGLSVSYFIISRNHGGTMYVESTPGIGTRFIITLPTKGVSHD